MLCTSINNTKILYRAHMMLCVPLMMLCIYLNVLHAYTPIMMLRLVTIDIDVLSLDVWYRLQWYCACICKRCFSTLQCVSYRFCAYMVCSTLMCGVRWTSLDVWCNRPWCCELHHDVAYRTGMMPSVWCTCMGALLWCCVKTLSNVGPYIHDLPCWVSIYIYSIMISRALATTYSYSDHVEYEYHHVYVKYLPWRDVLDYAYVIAWKVPWSHHDVVCHDVVSWCYVVFYVAVYSIMIGVQSYCVVSHSTTKGCTLFWSHRSTRTTICMMHDINVCCDSTMMCTIMFYP